MFCLSKGLCAPVGSMLVSSRNNIERARNIRKALGGGMRQAGVLAAAGLVALDEMTGRLQQDHDHARLLACALSKLPQVELDPALVQTNILIFNLRGGRDAEVLVSALADRGVLAGTLGPHSIRLVTHHDVDRAACQKSRCNPGRGNCQIGSTISGGKRRKSRPKMDLYYYDAEVFDRRALP